MKALLRRAADMGISVHAANLEPGVMGEWYADEREIYFDIRLTSSERRTVLAHELGHAHYDHRCCDGDADTERLADIYAARILIDPEEYAALERIDPDQHHLADDLNVTVKLIFTYEAHCLSRLRGITYALPRMGAWQWAHRAEVG